MRKNTLKSELSLARNCGFEATARNALARNPYLRLTDGSCLVWMAGKLISRVTTCTYFSTGQYLKCWKSSDGNKPWATMTTTQINASGVGTHTEIYYREIYKNEIAALARKYGCSESDIKVDHINHIRGDNRDSNLELATARQNNQNRSPVKIEKAFYTIEEVMEKLSTGEWTPASMYIDN